MRNSDFSGDPLLDSLLELAGCREKRDRVRVVNPEKQKALSCTYDILTAMQRSTGTQEKIDVKYQYEAGCATVAAEVPGMYLSAPWMLAYALAEASNVQMMPTTGGKIRISMYFGNYFRDIS